MKAMLLIFIGILSSCQHDAPTDLDLKQEKVLPPSDAVISSDKNVKAESVIKWQNFFKKTPTNKERSNLLKSVSSLRNTKAIEELLKRLQDEMTLGQLAAAEATAREILRRDGDLYSVYLDLALVYFRRGDAKKSMEILSQFKDQIAKLEAPDATLVFRYRYTLALNFIRYGDRKKGQSILSDLIGQDKSFTPGYTALASSYLQSGNTVVAKFILERAMDRAKEESSIYNLLGLVFDSESDPMKAKAMYDKALALDANFAPALVNRANYYMTQSDFGRAEQDISKALASDPQYTASLIAMSTVHKQRGRFKAAVELLERVLELEPDHSQARFNLALLMDQNLKDRTAAIRLYTEVLQTSGLNERLRNLAKSRLEDMESTF
jgi:Tfp pilus assembly protein PilF